jgi:hypothetical protein
MNIENQEAESGKELYFGLKGGAYGRGLQIRMQISVLY